MERRLRTGYCLPILPLEIIRTDARLRTIVKDPLKDAIFIARPPKTLQSRLSAQSLPLAESGGADLVSASLADCSKKIGADSTRSARWPLVCSFARILPANSAH